MAPHEQLKRSLDRDFEPFHLVGWTWLDIYVESIFLRFQEYCDFLLRKRETCIQGCPNLSQGRSSASAINANVGASVEVLKVSLRDRVSAWMA